MHRTWNYLVVVATTAGLTIGAAAQNRAPRPGPTFDWGQAENRIAWYGTVDGALAAADRTDRPILVMSAQPHCHGTPGIW